MKTNTPFDARFLITALAAGLALAGCGGSAPEDSGRIGRQAPAAEDVAKDGGVIEPVVVRPPGDSDYAAIDEEEWITADPDNDNTPGREAALRYMTRGGVAMADDVEDNAADTARMPGSTGEERRPPQRRAVAADSDNAASPSGAGARRPAATPAPRVVTVAPARRAPTPDVANAPRDPNARAIADRTTTAVPRTAPTAASLPGTARQLNQRAVAQINSGQADRAIPALERAAAMQPRDAEVLGNLGYAYLLAGDHSRARTHLMRALDISPTRSATWLNLGQTYAELGQRDVAVDAVLKGYRYSTRKPSVRSALQRAVAGSRHSEAWRTTAALALARINA